MIEVKQKISMKMIGVHFQFRGIFFSKIFISNSDVLVFFLTYVYPLSFRPAYEKYFSDHPPFFCYVYCHPVPWAGTTVCGALGT